MELVCLEEDASPEVDIQAKVTPSRVITPRRSERIQARLAAEQAKEAARRNCSPEGSTELEKTNKELHSLSSPSCSSQFIDNSASTKKSKSGTKGKSTSTLVSRKRTSSIRNKSTTEEYEEQCIYSGQLKGKERKRKHKEVTNTESELHKRPSSKSRKLAEDQSTSSFKKKSTAATSGKDRHKRSSDQEQYPSASTLEGSFQVIPESSAPSDHTEYHHKRFKLINSDNNLGAEGSQDSSFDSHSIVVSVGKGKRSKRKEKQKGKTDGVIHKSVIRFSMSNKSDKETEDQQQPGPSGLESQDTRQQQSEGNTAGEDPNEGGDNSEVDPFVALMNEETKRLQMMLEARGLPPHLLGSLGPRMPHLFSKHLSSSNNSKAQQLLDGLRCVEDESIQLQSCIEIGQLLVMGNEDTLSGFPVKDTVPALIQLLSMEHNFDIMMNASRALTYMMEALPRSTVVVADAIPVLLEKLQIIQCMDVAEQALSALEILSKKHSKSILQAGGVNACLLYLDFFSLTTQRSALSVAANCCISISEDEYTLVRDSIPILTGRLLHQDKKSVESCCLCFSRLIDNFVGNPDILQQIASHGLLANVQNLLIMSPSVISSNMFVTVVKMLPTLCSVCPVMAVELLHLNIAESLKYLLIGSEEITLDNVEMPSRSSNEVYEIVSLISELLPPLPSDGLFEVNELLNSTTKKPLKVAAQWEWQTDGGSWAPYKRSENKLIEIAHITGEDEVAIDIAGRTYIIEFAAKQQFNEETGNARAIRRSEIDLNSNKQESPKTDKKVLEEDPRKLTLCAEPELCANFMRLLLGVLFEEFNNMAVPSVKHRCLKAILRMLYTALPEILTDVLKDLSVSSYIATMLKSNDYRIVVGAIQMANVLIDKLPDIFVVYFHREGVMHVMESLKNLPLKAINTPKKPDQPSLSEERPLMPYHPPTPLQINPSMPPPPIQQLPSPSLQPQPIVTLPTTSPPKLEGATGISSESPSTARRFADIFRRSKRHLRKSFTKSRSEDTPRPPSVPTPTSQPSLLSMPIIPPPTLKSSGATPSLPSTSGSSNHGESVIIVSMDRSDDPLGKPMGLSALHAAAESEAKAAKEKIRDWIQNQATRFLEKWSIDTVTDKNSALDVMKKLRRTIERLDPSSPDCLDGIKDLYSVLSNTVTSVSPFELINCKVPQVLEKVLSCEDAKMAVPLNMRLKHFSSIFMGLPENDPDLSSWIPQERPGLLLLLTKLHKCINQIENFPIKVYDTQGRRGSQAMKFFNTHQIKCMLEVHPTAIGLRNFKGGTVRVDPLATMQAIERYLIVKGVTKPEQQKTSEDSDGSEDSDSDEGMLPSLPLGPTKRQLEFLIKDHLIPQNMTVFQAVKTFELNNAEESEEEVSPFGNPEIWIRSHLIHYRMINQGGLRPKRSYSVPNTPMGGQTHSKASQPISIGASSAGSKTKRNIVSTSLTTPIRPIDARVTRSMSREKHHQKMEEEQERKDAQSPTEMEIDLTDGGSNMSYKLSPLIQNIRKLKEVEFSVEDPSLPVISLIGILYQLNNHWNDLYSGFSGNAVVSTTEFVNIKLTSKASRQLQDPLNVMTGNFPGWLKEITKQCPFLFTFEYRQTFFYLTAFDRDRAILKLQEQQPELSTIDSNERITPKLEKKKKCVSREGLLNQAEQVMDEFGSSRALLEIQYKDEVGTGLGPTLEFYTLVSRELQQANLQMWRGDPCPLPGSSSSSSSNNTQASNVSPGVIIPQYIHSPVGLFPAPLAADTSFSVVEEICNKFRFLGCFMAKAIMDLRMLDLPLSEAFYTWMLGQEDSFTAQDLQHIDPLLSRTFAQLADVAVRKHQLECDPLLTGKALQMGIEALTLEGGGSVEALELDFTLPGYPYIELKPHGRDLPVNVHNLDEYLKLVVDWTLVKGVRRQMEAFREGFNKVFPITSLQQFYPQEMDILLCGANSQKWDIKELVENCRPDHGYTHDSPAVQFLFDVLSSYNTTEQRQFIQFVTGSPRLPVGGFKALNPPLTIVRKRIEGQSSDSFLPSVMTCVNYLKLPDYSTKDVMKERLDIALREGKHSFHLS